MSHLAMLQESLDRAQERFEAVLASLSLEEANAFPLMEQVPTIKSVTWLAWHTAREIDLQIADLAGQPPLWLTEGWKEKFRLDLPDDTQDWRHSPEEAVKVTVTDLSLLTGYLAAAVTLAKTYLAGLDQTDLAEVIDESWEEPVTRAARLVSIIDDAAMHSGQVVYAQRLLALGDGRRES